MAAANVAQGAAFEWQTPDAWHSLPGPRDFISPSESSEWQSDSSCSDELSSCTFASEDLSTDWCMQDSSACGMNPYDGVSDLHGLGRLHKERERLKEQDRTLWLQALRALDFDARTRQLPRHRSMAASGEFLSRSQRRRRSISPHSPRSPLQTSRMSLNRPCLTEEGAQVWRGYSIDGRAGGTTRETARDNRLSEIPLHLNAETNLEGIQEIDQNPAVNMSTLTAVCSQYNSMHCRGPVGALLDSHAVGFNNVPGSSIYWTSRPLTASFNHRSTSIFYLVLAIFLLYDA